MEIELADWDLKYAQRVQYFFQASIYFFFFFNLKNFNRKNFGREELVNMLNNSMQKKNSKLIKRKVKNSLF